MKDDRTRKALSLVLAIGFFIAMANMPAAWGHGVPPQFQSSDVKIENEQFSDQTLRTSETLTVTGIIHNLSGSNFRVSSLSLMAESSFDLGEPWEVLARDPPSTSFDVPASGSVPYSLTIKVLRPNTYHVHTQADLQNGQTILGRGQTVVVVGPTLNGLDQGTITLLVVLIPVVAGVGAAGLVVWKKRSRRIEGDEKDENPPSAPIVENKPSDSYGSEPPQKDRSTENEPALKDSKFKD